jgi:peptide/nickel transport system substrate-binding protein
LNALLGGQVDAAYLTAATVNAAKSKGKTIVSDARAVDYKGILLLDRAGNKNPALGKVEVRQALNYAIDRAALAKAVEVNAQPTTQVFSPNGTAYKKSLDSYYTYNVAKAKELMSKAGYADGFTINLNNWAETNLNALVEGYLKAINVKINWVQDTNWYGNAKAGKFEAIIMQIFQGTDLVTAETAVAKDGGWNNLKYESAAMKKAWAVLSQTGTANQVKVQTALMNQIAVEEAWFVPFYRVLHYTATSSRVKAVIQAQNAVPYLYNYAPTGK